MVKLIFSLALDLFLITDTITAKFQAHKKMKDIFVVLLTCFFKKRISIISDIY